MIDKEHFTFKNYILLEPYTGSMNGLRYMFRAEGERNEKGKLINPVLMVYVWPEPFAFAHTDADKITSQEFPYTDEGFDEAIDWVNGMEQ